ncbi:hypothetical protein EMPS_00522 [Entomortierella parvispora]|uniref:Ricin B lectin domain-containing protein n=1 Tax=Entomortierella parvispora TaxID=205924 RepID=A0A9P3H155_9FUNG|nr:hypothetical protein EMPS_00522 [Entomortierella parvispora]
MTHLAQFIVLVFTLVVSLQVVIAQTLHQIQNIRAGSDPIGVDPLKILSLPVREGAQLNKWTIEKTEGSNRYFLHIQNAPPNVGVAGNGVVTASLDDKRVWEIVRDGQKNAFTIQLATGLWPGQYWTAGNGPTDTVTLRVSDFPTEDQLWMITPVVN